MKLVILRHAEAEDGAGSDFERRLTAKGQKQAQAVGQFYSRSGLHFDIVYSSPYPRALETARIVAGMLSPAPEVVEDKVLGCGMRPEAAVSLLRQCEDSFPAVLLVGHQPDLGRLCAYLSGTHDGGNFAFKKGCTAIFDLWRCTGGGGVLEAFVPVRLLKDSGK